MTNYSGKMNNLLTLRAKVDRAIAMEAERQGRANPRPAPAKGVGYVVFPCPTLAAAAADIVRYTS